MATQAGRALTVSKFEDWVRLIEPFAPRVPAVWLSTGNFSGFVAITRNFFNTVDFTDAELQGNLQTRLLGKTNQINSATGSTITWNPALGAWQAQPLPIVAPFDPTLLEPAPPLTPAQVEALQPGVGRTIATDIEDLVAAGRIAPFPAPTNGIVLQGEPPLPPLDTPDVVGEIQPDARLSVAAPEAGALIRQQIIRDDPMNGTNVFGQPAFTLPTVRTPSIQAGGDFDLTAAGIDLALNLLRGEPVIESLVSGAETLFGITDTGDTLPTPQLPGVAPGLQREFLDWLKLWPPTLIAAHTVDALLGFYRAGTAPTSPGGGVPGPIGPGLNGRACDFPTTTNTSIQTVHRAPPGFVVVTCNINGIPTKQAMWKPLAIKLGLWKRPKKPPVSAAEWNTVKKAKRVTERVTRVLGSQLSLVKKKAPARRAAAVCK